MRSDLGVPRRERQKYENKIFDFLIFPSLIFSFLFAKNLVFIFFFCGRPAPITKVWHALIGKADA
ncbi:MAG: hypothetical protein LBP35_01105 [Candidatus Ancillula trichonymphae]|jgi:hypothetical protein|nr:hypothetical protein [Candidatus Ancillula trichonymphae]